MSRLTEYNQELTGVMFDALDDMINAALEGDGPGGAGQRPLQEYTEAELRQLWRAGRIDEAQWTAELQARGANAQAASDQIARQKTVGISTAAATRGQLTPSEAAAVNAFQNSVIQATPTPVPANAGAQSASAGAGGASDASLVAANPGSARASASADASAGGVSGVTAGAPTGGNVGPGGRTVAQIAGKPYMSEEERAWYLAQPAAERAAAEAAARGGASPGTGGTGGTGTAAATRKPAASGELGALLDSFEGFSDKDVINAYYQGEIDRDQLKQLLDIRNTTTNKDGSTTSKYTDASLERYLKQVDAEKPQKKLTKADLLGTQGANLAAKFNPRAEGFGSVQSVGTGSGINATFDDLFGPGSGGTGAIVAFDQFGRPELSHLSLGGQQMAATASQMSPLNGGKAWGTSTADILAQRGIKPTGDPVKDAELLSQSLATQAMNAEMFPGASPSDLNRMSIIGLTGQDPATRRVNPATGNYADLDSALGPIEPFATGGRVSVRSRDVIGAGPLAPQTGGEEAEPDTALRGIWNDEEYQDRIRRSFARDERRSELAEQEQKVLKENLETALQARRRAAQGYLWDMAGLPRALEIPKPLLGGGMDLPIGVEYAFEPESVRERRRDALLNPPPPAPAPAPPVPQVQIIGPVPGMEWAPRRSFAGGGDMVTDEPLIGVGVYSREPRFVMSEGEMLSIEPLDKSFAATNRRKRQEDEIIGAASLLSESGRKALSTLVHGRVA